MHIENENKQGDEKPAERNISELLRKGNLPQAEILLRIFLERDPNNPEALYLLGKIATEVNLPHFALHYFSEAVKLAPSWQLPQINRDRVSKYLTERQGAGLKSVGAQQAEKFLLIKAWGCGFWSDVSHVLGQLLVAELAGRTPIVHWGANSLYGDGTTANAFEFYFETFSEMEVADLQRENFDFWPPKWNKDNLLESAINRFEGPFSRIAGLYLLGREERVVVSDFFTSVFDLKPWIPIGHHLYGLSIDELWLYLVRQYLHPKQEILDVINMFYEKYLVSSDFIAVHARGSDKGKEVTNLYEMNTVYKHAIDQHLSSCNSQRIFLMTDDTVLLDYFKKLYGNKIVTTDCQRTSGTTGLHFLGVSDKRRLGTEVMVDVYLAARANAFVGNGFSNPSRFVRYLKNWPEGTVNLIGLNRFNMPNLFLHNR